MVRGWRGCGEGMEREGRRERSGEGMEREVVRERKHT